MSPHRTDLANSILLSLLHPDPLTPLPRPADRRIRIVLNKKYIVDTARAFYVWEHPYYPYFYVPETDVEGEVKEGSTFEVEDNGKKGEATVLEVGVGQRKRNGLRFGRGDWVHERLEGLVRFGFGEMDAWYEEDTPIYVHPKDPTKRISVLPSSRPLRIKLGSHTLVDINPPNTPQSTQATPSITSYIRLIEPLLPVRYYLPATSIDPSLLRPSSTRSLCPYKGEAEYYDVVTKDEKGKEVVYKDLIWYYRFPLPEVAALMGMLCFFNEKVDVFLDGELLERARSKFV